MTETPINFTPEKIHPMFLEAIDQLREIQPRYGKIVASLRRATGIQNRACGPNAFGLAVFLQSTLGNLPIDASIGAQPETSEGIHLVYGLQQENNDWRDHAWIEANQDGQTLIISPESAARAALASFRATVVNQHLLALAYPEIGVKRLQSGIEEANIADEFQLDLKDILDQINNGQVPDNYEKWVQILLAEIS